VLDLGALGGRDLAGRYRIEGPLGSGGMAVVFAARDLRLDRPVAVKVLRPQLAADAAMRRRFDDEARSAARLSSPFVVAVFDTGDDGDAAFLVMERLPGVTLADRMRAGPMPPAEVRSTTGDMLAGLDAAHRIGLVHRDVKPSNVLLGADGRAKVADFGIAKSVDPRTARLPPDPTVTGVVLGTPGYLSPERLAGRPATPQSDLYAVGVVVLSALTGTDPASASLSDPRVPPAFAAVIHRALAPRPDDRFGSAADMAFALGIRLGRPRRDDTAVVVGAPRSGAVPNPDDTGVVRIVADPGAVPTAAADSATAGASVAGAAAGGVVAAAAADGAGRGTRRWDRTAVDGGAGRPRRRPAPGRMKRWVAVATGVAVVALVAGAVVAAEAGPSHPSAGLAAVQRQGVHAVGAHASGAHDPANGRTPAGGTSATTAPTTVPPTTAPTTVPPTTSPPTTVRRTTVPPTTSSPTTAPTTTAPTAPQGPAGGAQGHGPGPPGGHTRSGQGPGKND